MSGAENADTINSGRRALVLRALSQLVIASASQALSAQEHFPGPGCHFITDPDSFLIAAQKGILYFAELFILSLR